MFGENIAPPSEESGPNPGGSVRLRPNSVDSGQNVADVGRFRPGFGGLRRNFVCYAAGGIPDLTQTMRAHEHSLCMCLALMHRFHFEAMAICRQVHVVTLLVPVVET